jgi:hypothetical protein
LQNFDAGQVNILMNALLIAGIYLISKKREVAGGMLFGFAAMFKYMPVLFIPYFFLRKRYRIFFAAIGSIALYCLFPAFFTGVKHNFFLLKHWLPFISNTSFDSISLVDYKNQSLLAAVLRFSYVQSPYGIELVSLNKYLSGAIAMMLSLILYVLSLYPRRHHETDITPEYNRFYDNLDFGLLCICMALLNPNAWLINFVALIFPYMVLICYLLRIRFKDKFLVGVLAGSFILGSLPSETLLGNTLENLFEVYSSVTFSALVVFAGLLKLKFGKISLINTQPQETE